MATPLVVVFVFQLVLHVINSVGVEAINELV
jgi:hypothetical protein